MSLILDALRKSEAERRRGQSPSLYSANPIPSTRARPEWLRWLPLVALAVLVVVALFAWRGEPGPVTRGELEAEAGAPAPEALDAGAESLPEPEPVVTRTVAPPPPAPAPAAAASEAPAPTVDSLVKPTPAPPTVMAPSPAPTIVATAPPSPAPAEQAPAEQLPPLAVLDTSTRSSLPALKLSMHVFNNEPARRFAIIDGQRVTEGAQLGGATVVEIRRDGVVLDVGGRRVLLPRP